MQTELPFGTPELTEDITIQRDGRYGIAEVDERPVGVSGVQRDDGGYDFYIWHGETRYRISAGEFLGLPGQARRL